MNLNSMRGFASFPCLLNIEQLVTLVSSASPVFECSSVLRYKIAMAQLWMHELAQRISDCFDRQWLDVNKLGET